MFQKCLVKKDLSATPKLVTKLRNRQYHFEAYRSVDRMLAGALRAGGGRVGFAGGSLEEAAT